MTPFSLETYVSTGLAFLTLYVASVAWRKILTAAVRWKIRRAGVFWCACGQRFPDMERRANHFEIVHQGHRADPEVRRRILSTPAGVRPRSN